MKKNNVVEAMIATQYILLGAIDQCEELGEYIDKILEKININIEDAFFYFTQYGLYSVKLKKQLHDQYYNNPSTDYEGGVLAEFGSWFINQTIRTGVIPSVKHGYNKLAEMAAQYYLANYPELSDKPPVVASPVVLEHKYYYKKRCKECFKIYFQNEITAASYARLTDNPNIECSLLGNDYQAVITSHCDDCCNKG